MTGDPHAWDTGLYGACGACASVVTGDPVLGAAAGALIAAGIRHVLIPYGVAVFERLLDVVRRTPPPPAPPPPPAA